MFLPAGRQEDGNREPGSTLASGGVKDTDKDVCATNVKMKVG